MKKSSRNSTPSPQSPSRIWEPLGLISLTGLLIYFLAISWRRWPDPVIDFGRELYLPWRLSHGAVLYRDVDDIYGPLSQYLNAALFTMFGPGLMILVAANLLILVLIMTLAYVLFRRAWGVGAALFGVAIFITVFSASQFGGVGNFNYLTPYSEETTHGFFVCLTLAFVLVRWVENGTQPGSFLAGFLLGLTLVLKPEFVLAGGLLFAAAIGSRIHARVPIRIADIVLLTLGAILPTLIFTAFFAVTMPLPEAASAASRAWLNALNTSRFTNDNLELGFLGLDNPWLNVRHQIFAVVEAALLFSAIGATAWCADKIERRWLRFIATGLLAVAVLGFSLHTIAWPRAARCLPGLILLYLALSAVQVFRQPGARAQIPRLLLAILALALLARMILRPRVFDYGYYQAALAAMMIPAMLLAELPAWLRLGRGGTLALAVALLTLFVPGVVTLSAISYENLRLKTVPVGTGLDRFYSSQLDGTGALVDSVANALRAEPPSSTLLVLPEGTMINYLARLPSPIAPYAYYAEATAGGRENQIVADLQSHPPDLVVIISRPLLEYGIVRYGTETDNGLQILTWVNRNYLTSFARGGNPLDFWAHGVRVLTPGPEASFR